jgi:RNA polymerase sigma-70 factor (ECF subfamily)
MADSQPNAGDERLFAEWVCEHGGAVRGFLLALVRRPDVAEDLAQEVFCRAWQARARYREQGSARAYLLRIADRLVCDRSRARKQFVNLDKEGWGRHDPPDPSVGPSAALLMVEAKSRLTEALDRLSPAQRRVLLLRYYGQLGFAEIAATIGLPLSTTLSHCRRGLEMLRRMLVEEMP